MAENLKSPCAECGERCVGCHGRCEKYNEWRSERDTDAKRRRDAHIVGEYIRYNAAKWKRIHERKAREDG